ncbi:MAG: Competence protein ComEA [Candidatus Pacebacteria bacterium GW2011_GWF1_36_5]|nr:MAG: Competence protein ComEA [Candidatus Pacebacteria bacterium GW2011_GWF1_36_5]
MATFGVRSLLASSETLECFCPSCPDFTLADGGIASLGLIKVDIQGAVKKPGIYQLEIGQRLSDLIALADGFDPDADQAYVAKTLNLATELKNQDKIYIPFFEEVEDSSNNDNGNVATSVDLESSDLISINQSTATQLKTLSGIGEVKAQAIIDARPYASLEELVSKSVLSENLFNDLKVQLTL